MRKYNPTIFDSQGDLLKNIGGLVLSLLKRQSPVPTSANAEYYAKIVAEKAMPRRLISKLTGKFVNQAYEASKPADANWLLRLKRGSLMLRKRQS